MNLKEIFKKQGGMKLLKQYWQGGALFTGIVEFLLLGRSRTALEILRLSTQLKTKEKLKKIYEGKIEEIEATYNKSLPKKHKQIIWVCWLQGMDYAPDIVRVCYESICNHIKNRKVILITEDNYRAFVKFPQHIQKKIDDGLLKGAHMTDLLRLELLLKYGGTWIDATVLCTSSDIPEYMLNSDLFVFQCLKPGRDGHTNVFSNWFITACSNNKVLYMVRELLYYYWSEHDELIDYFIFHETASVVIDRYPEEWEHIVPFSNSVPHMLLLRFFCEYDNNTWNAIKNQTPFHKLTYKYKEDDAKKTGTYFEKMMKGLL